ncbi:GPW/gp25 family protein [Engelhardtia mirabilis]|uniref:Gene 25-like lysozyme n=1 Tax=Engelhardtia mirabilis TaxID=2528011 RepID=A0A518BPS1_9BACT|nr:Gene 25-like lysozyme [Planctomycetes bacterium Pla133]QDV03260.1 Gene 25-like lysozyme [Planctomycetes bacterium Pla86]
MELDPTQEPAGRSFEDAYLGRGWAFPVTWRTDRDGGGGRVRVNMAEKLEDIQQSIRLILETAMGERVMNPEFGSEVQRYVFAPITPQSMADLGRAVRQALIVWERRIRGVEVDVGSHQGEIGRLDVKISFFVDTHRMRQSFIFPFYVDQPGGQ